MSFFNKNSGKKVDFLIIGAQKCGTSSVFNHLILHPALCGSKEKEINYFNNHYNYKLGEKWYHAHWKKFGKKGNHYFEGSPIYWYNTFTPERIAAYNPEMKFICLVRDPVKRAFSHYNMYKHITASQESKDRAFRWNFQHYNPEIENFVQNVFFNPKGFPTFEQFIDEEMELMTKSLSNMPEPSFLRRGLYLEQLERFYNFFPRERFIIFENLELEKETEMVLNRICKFIGADMVKWDTDLINKKHHLREYFEPMKEETFIKLSQFYKPFNEKFLTRIGKNYQWS